MLFASRVAFELFGQPIYWYGILMAVAILSAYFLCAVREKRMGFERDVTLSLALWVVPPALVCARLYFVAFEWENYRDNLWEILNVRSGGMAIYGAILGGVLAGWLFARKKRLPFLRLCDLVAPALALGQAIGRWANFVNQEAFGYAVSNPGLQFFPFAVFIEADGLWHLATFFYESVWCFAVCAGLLIAQRRGKFNWPGQCFTWYALLYAAERAVVEGLRTDSLMMGPVRVSQFLSAAAVAVCVALLIIHRHKSTTTNGRRSP